MATHDVPGANPANGDELAMGCWAEHSDGSLIFVESTEQDTVVYSVFDVSRRPAMEFRDAMPEDGFKRQFSWPGPDQWTWHDKTPFPWQRVMRNFPPGSRVASAADLENAAQRLARRRNLSGSDVDEDDVEHLQERLREAQAVMEGIQRAIDRLQP